MPCFFAALKVSTAPFGTPGSVRPMAGWPYAAARSARASILHAPSSSEYSEWTCRCATEELLIRAENHDSPARWKNRLGRKHRAAAGLTFLLDCRTIRRMGSYGALGVRRVINACGIYTDL